MKLFSRKGEEPPSTFPIDAFSEDADDFSHDGHLGAMASPHYCNDMSCWCHSDSNYHSAITSLPAGASGDNAFRAYRQFLDDDGERYVMRDW